jgi:guanylate kinase
MSLPGKLLVFTAPSGSGKTTVVRHILKTFPSTAFSISATTRPRRAHEVDGKDYHFITPEQFKILLSEYAFAEWEEVYRGQFYGTLKSEIERIHQEGKHVVFDVDVKGALSIKYLYPEETLAVFIKVPNMDILEKRLRSRGTESEESIQKRLKKASLELSYEDRFDVVLINEDLQTTLRQAEDIVQKFLL